MNLRLGRFVEFTEERGRTIPVGERCITPVVRTPRVGLSRAGVPLAVAFVWTRPVAVEVAEPEGEGERDRGPSRP